MVPGVARCSFFVATASSQTVSVCEKWLKDRKGRTLSDDDIAHYQKMVVALAETIRLMQEIDEVIEQYGGWPDAFAQGRCRDERGCGCG
jgi:hypothetical protein